MGLRDFLMNINAGTQSLADTNASAEKFRQQEAARQFAQNVPGLMQRGDISGVTGALAEFDPQKAGELALSQSMKQQAMVKPKTSQEIKTLYPNIDQKQADLIATYNSAGQEKTLADMSQRMSAESRQAGVEQRKISNINTANSKYHSEMKDVESQIANMDRAEHVIAKINEDAGKEGGIKATKPLVADIQGAVATALSGKGMLTVHGAEQQQVNTAEGSLNENLTWLTSHPNDVVPPEMMDQIHKDIKLLQGSYANQHRNNFEAFNAGVDESIQPKMRARFEKYREGYGVDAPKVTVYDAAKYGDIIEAVKDGPDPASAMQVIDAWKSRGLEMPSDKKKMLLERYGKR